MSTKKSTKKDIALFGIDNQTLLSVLKSANTISQGSPGLPYMGHIYFEISDRVLTTYSYGENVVIIHPQLPITSCPQANIGLAVPISSLSALVSRMSKIKGLEQEWQWSRQASDDNYVKVKLGEFSATFPLLDPKTLPPVPNPEFKHRLTVRNFQDSLKKITYAVSTEDTRVAIQCVCIRRRGRNAEAVAADGFRLAVVRLESTVKRVELLNKDILIPPAALRAICSLKDDLVTFSTGSNFTRATSGGTQIVFFPPVASFPPHTQLIPLYKKSHRLTCDRRQLMDRIQVTKSLMDHDGWGKTLRLKTKTRNVLTISSQNPGAHHTPEKFEISMPCRGEIAIALNCGFALDAIQKLVEDQVTIYTTGKGAPCMVTENNMTHVIMPMFVSEEDE